MSTQELLAIIGYVKPQEQSKFPSYKVKKSMTKEEKEIYEKKLLLLEDDISFSQTLQSF